MTMVQKIALLLTLYFPQNAPAIEMQTDVKVEHIKPIKYMVVANKVIAEFKPGSSVVCYVLFNKGKSENTLTRIDQGISCIYGEHKHE